MRIIIEIENGHTTVTVDDETAYLSPGEMPEEPEEPYIGQ